MLPGGKGLVCQAGGGYEGGVRFCEGNGSTQRVPSWDGVPLDVNVTLPNPAEHGAGPYPTIVMLHGYGGSKTELESTKPEGNGNESFDYNNDYFAQHGYAVVNYTARGFGKSCGILESKAPECEAHGFIHLADQRYEARDTQYLLGLLVEEGIAKPGALGVTGISYGGGQSITLAYLKNRIRCAGPPDETYAGLGADPCKGQAENAFVPWETPRTKQKLEIDAAYARWPWSDIATSLVPNGRFLEYEPKTFAQDGASGTSSPIGVPITSYEQALYSGGALGLGYYEPITGSLEWNLSLALLLFDHPEQENPMDQALINGLSAYHGGFALASSQAPAPLLMQSGWNDDLFPPKESLRVYNSVRERYGHGSYVALQFGDVGHSRSTNGPIQDQYFNAQGAAFFEEKLDGKAGATVEDKVAKTAVTAPAAGQATTFTTTCGEPQSESESGPYVGGSWQALQRGVVKFSSTTPQVVSNPASPEDSLVGAEFDPILQEGRLGKTPEKLNVKSTPEPPKACRAISAIEPKGTASYFEPVTETITMMGLPTIEAKISVSGTERGNGQLDARLWVVHPGAKPSETTERLVSRGDYRLEEPQTPNVVFQLHGNGYTIPAGDVLKLELTSSEYPYYYQSSTARYSIAVSAVNVYLPTYTAPTGKLVTAPVQLPVREAPLPQPEKPVAKEPSAKAIEGLVTTLPPLSTTPPSPLCMTNWPVRIKLPKLKHGRIVRAVVMFNGRRRVYRLRRAARKRGSLHFVSYTLAGATGRTSTVKIALTLKLAGGKHRKGRAKTKRIIRRYHLCG
ncbi:MAG: CocE/NonD family hydrolase [Solirubrobacteraceae bacterium]